MTIDMTQYVLYGLCHFSFKRNINIHDIVYTCMVELESGNLILCMKVHGCFNNIANFNSYIAYMHVVAHTGEAKRINIGMQIAQ